ncbi:MAG TPA: transcription-repair coupling factor [Sphingomicrobium sp.]|nr:transcription-repair coupling factor [Sphingomicrobium sp.]
MSLRSLPSLLRADPTLTAMAGRGAAVLAVPEPARAFTVAGLAQMTGRHPLVVAMPTGTDAERLAHDVRAFLGEDHVDTFPAWETLPFERVSPSVETMGRRLRTMWHLRNPERMPRVLVAPVKALVQRLGPHVEEAEPEVLAPGDQVDPEELVARLVGAGYRREYQVEHRGEVAVRGSIVDVFPSTADVPVRIDLWGDEVDRLTEFAVADQRSTHDVAQVEIFACRELLPTPEVRERAARLVGAEPWGREQWERLAEGLVFDGMESWLPWLTEGEHLLPDLIGPDAQVLLVEPRRMRDRAADLLDEEAALAGTLAGTWGAGERAFPQLHLPFDRLLAHTRAPVWSVTSVAEGPDTPAVVATGWDPVVGDGSRLAKQLTDLVGDGFRVVIAADGEGTAARITTRLRDEAVGGVEVVVAPLERGFVLPSVKLAVLGESDVTGRRRPHRRPRARPRATEGFFDDLAPGDYVVHHSHGVARYGGMVKSSMGGAERDYLLLEYRGGDRLYVPSDQIDLVRPYTGGEAPSLHKLGGVDWQRSKARVRSAVREIAQELIVLYRRRVTSTGHAFDPDTPWQHELEQGFPYVETPDQLKAIEEVKADMEEAAPMDRLVCGDVGFGKTEVALRAAFVVAMSGMQVALICPTTLLARQHYSNFVERLHGFPVEVGRLSRLVPAAEAKKTKEGLEKGTVDIVIGTHALLAKGLKFRKLGLVIVDEEQHFGVTHKERLKALRADVHVLTLTATPIPRTLQMAMSGLRELSVIQTPPVDRLAIRTYVTPWDGVVIREALLREHYRGGQSFFVAPRIKDLPDLEDWLREHVPEVNFVTAHGQMSASQVEERMSAFYDRKYDVLLSTSIVESGLDIPSANTLIVHRADRFGLAQLYQLRGRVGRAKVRAYAYLTTPADRLITDTAAKRLQVLADLDSLGAGFQLASHDLDIRGAGNLLGDEQSGHIKEVGFELYQSMLEEAIVEMKSGGIARREDFSPQISVDAPILIPEHYVPDLDLRMGLYRRLGDLEDKAAIEEFAAELIDRFGPLPEETSNLLRIVETKLHAKKAMIAKLDVGARGAVITFAEGGFPDLAGLLAYIERLKGAAKLRPDSKLSVSRNWPTPADRLNGALQVSLGLARVAAAGERERPLEPA